MTFWKIAMAVTLSLTGSLTGTRAIAADLWRAQADEGFTILFDGDRLGKAAGGVTTAVYYMDSQVAVRRFAELHVEFNCAARQVRVARPWSMIQSSSSCPTRCRPFRTIGKKPMTARPARH